eukprot:jgi/Mesvir1/9307/Mv03433-RA.1
MRLGSQFKLVGATDKGLGLVMFENVIRDFIKRDIVAFNALRGQILDKIDVWWSATERCRPSHAPRGSCGQDSIEFIKNIQKATYALTGTIPKCPNGSSTVWYDRDPTDPKARIVDETITAADGTRVRNPFARFGMCADEPFGADVMAGYPNQGYAIEPSGGGHYLVNGARRFNVDYDDRRRKADAWWNAMTARRAARNNVYASEVSFNRGYMEAFGNLYRGKQQLTEDEKEVVDAYRAEGEPALKGDTLTEWTASSVPSTGWVSCIVCSGIMPAHKVEFTRPVPSRDLFVFYHSTCFDSLTASDSLRVQERVPPAPPVTDIIETQPVIIGAVDWDLDKPTGGYDC